MAPCCRRCHNWPAPAAPAGPTYPDSVKAYVGSVKKQIKTINMEQFRALVDKKASGLIVDVRQENEFEDGFVPGAVNVPRGLIEFRIWKLVGFPGAVDMKGGLAVLLGLSALGALTLPMALAFFLFEVGLVATLQAFIFATLTAIYVGGAVAESH